MSDLCVGNPLGRPDRSLDTSGEAGGSSVGIASGATVVFLVYDSRSGSTMLSRNLVERLDRVLVTPELAFDAILRGTRIGCRRSAVHMVWALIRTRGIRNLSRKVRQAIIKEARASTADDPASVINMVLRNWGSIAQEDVPTRSVIVKGGTHARYWRRLQRAYRGNVKFIYLTRDPRGVIDSKLRTTRPYAPHETMAWGGALLAAIRWLQYAKAMRKARSRGLKLLEIRYEDFVASPATVLAVIADFIGVPLSMRLPREAYTIPKSEQKIHLHAASRVINQDRAKLWWTRLADGDRRIIEAACYREMRARGYEPVECAGVLIRWFRCARAIPPSLHRIVSHYRGTGGRLRRLVFRVRYLP